MGVRHFQSGRHEIVTHMKSIDWYLYAFGSLAFLSGAKGLLSSKQNRSACSSKTLLIKGSSSQ